MDNWKHRAKGMRCSTCMYFVVKQVDKQVTEDKENIKEIYERGALGRCRRNAPTIKGWPALFSSDWCGEHKLDENKV